MSGSLDLIPRGSEGSAHKVDSLRPCHRQSSWCGAGLLLVALGLLFSRQALAQKDYPPDVLEKYWACMERNDLAAVRQTLAQHQKRPIDASVYGLPKNDFDDASLLTIQERLMIRKDKIRNGNPLPETGPLQYPHHLRQALDNWYEVTGQRPDCSKILADAGGKSERETTSAGDLLPETIQSGWAADRNLTTGDASDRGEVNIAIDPANPARLMASSCPAGGGETSNHIAYTSNWGQTWTSTQVGNNSGSTWECDPVSYYQRSTGAVYHSKIGCSTGTCPSTYTMLRRSTDNGATWTDCGRPAAQTSEDRQWHVVDNTPTSPGYGNIYITWHNSNQERVARSTNNCTSFGNLTNLTATGNAITPDINVARDGRVYVVWGNFTGATFRIAGSSDQGVNWNAPASKSLKPYNGNWSNSVPSQCVRKVSTQPLVDVDRAPGSAFLGRIYVAMLDFNQACTTQGNWSCATWDTNWTNACNYDVWLTFSDDNGVNWSSPVNVTAGEGNNVDHLLGYMRVDEADGSIWMGYHRSRLNPSAAADRQKTHYFVRRSTDGGSTWETTQVSTLEGDERRAGASTFERGDYQGFTVLNGVGWPLWIDRRNAAAEEEIVVRKICSEPAHWSERSPTFAAAPTTVVSNGDGTVTVSWTAPDIFWGDGDETPSSRKYQLWVDGSLAADNLLWTSTSTTHDPGNCSSHSYQVRAVNQCGISKSYATTSFSATGCCPNNPSSVNVTPNGPLDLCEGTPQLLTATPTGGSGLSYEWTRDGVTIAGATSSTFTANDLGTHSYNCEVKGSGCPVGTTDPTPTQVGWSVAPYFAGLTSVTTTSGTTCSLALTWPAASSACGGTFSYNVYRSTSTGFVPSTANWVAANVIGTSYTDSAALTGGTPYFYVVRAVSSVSGAEDANTVERSGTPLGPLTNQTLYSNDFETGSGLSDWTRGTFVAGGSVTDWRGIQSCTARSGSNIFRFGGNNCTQNYSDGVFAFAAPNGAAGIAVPAGSSSTQLSFWHRWEFETGFDGGLLLVSTNGTNYTVVPEAAISGTGYNATTAADCPPTGGGGRRIFSGTQATFVNTLVDLDAACDAIAGNTGGCAGKNVWIAFTAISDCGVNANGWFLDDVAVTADVGGSCATAASDVRFLTARATGASGVTSGSVKVEWLNPTGSYTGTRILRKTGSAPTGPTDALATVVIDDNGAFAGQHRWVTDTGLSLGTTYYYAAYVSLSGTYSSGKHVIARPQDSTSASIPVRWVYSTGATNLAPPGIGPSLKSVSNDRIAHATAMGPAGGDWPSTWTPVVMNGPSQSRPLIRQVTVGAATKVSFIGSQDGRVYCVNADTGAVVWTSPDLGGPIQGSPVGTFTAYGHPYSLIYVGTRSATSGNRIHALNVSNGTIAWTFENGGDLVPANAIGIISGALSVDPVASRVYFASRARSGGSADTLWCVSFNASTASKVWSQAVGDVDGSVTKVGSRVYAGTTGGAVVARNADGTGGWTLSLGDGPVKGFLWPDAGTPTHLYLSTTNRVWKVRDDTSAGTKVWDPGVAVPSPSAAAVWPGASHILVGSGDGKLYQLDKNGTAGQTPKSVPLGAGTSAVGAVALDVTNGLAYAGSGTGALYAVAVPLP